MTRVAMTVPQLRRRECSVDGRPVRLMPQTANLLALLLVAGPNRTVAAPEIIEALWPNPDREPATALNVVRVQLSHLRHHGIPVEGRNGFGYRIPRAARHGGDRRSA